MESALSVIVIAVAAFLLPLASGRIGVPAVVLEIVFGILIGPSVLGWIVPSEVLLDYLAELGFLLLMFLSGFEIDFGKLERGGVRQVSIGLAVFAVTVALSYRAAILLGHGPFVTLVLATTSVGLVVPTLRSTRRTSTPLGQAVLIAALMADFLTLIAATVYAMVAERGVGWHLLNFPILFGAVSLLLVFVRRLAWWYPERVGRMFEPDDPDEIGIRASLALMFVVVGLSYLLGVEEILGAFFAGAAFAMVFRHRGHLEQKLSGLSWGFLIPIFFIHVGMRFDLGVLGGTGVLLGAAALLAAAVVLKVLAAGVLFALRLSVREVLAAGLLLSARLSLVIAVTEIGARLRVVGPVLESQVILLAVVTATLSPIAFRMLAPPVDAPSAADDRGLDSVRAAGVP